MHLDIILPLLICGLALYFFYRHRKKIQLAYIESYSFSSGIKNRLLIQYPHLQEDQANLVLEALRDYFQMCSSAKRRVVSMPSQAVDVAWHAFILDTRAYKLFCNKALGRFLHHTPSESMRSPTIAQEGIKRAWRLACAKENIDPAQPSRLPLIFAIDAKLAISDGFSYSLNCKDRSSSSNGGGSGADYCASHIGCTSGCSGDSGADSDSGVFFSGFGSGSSGCSGDSGGGCGGD